jgi:sarcosine oxidase, subunit beta
MSNTDSHFAPRVRRFDVVVVGAGVIGASCAYHLSRRGLKVAIVEALSGPAEGSTGLCFASIRAQWADAPNIELAWRSIQAYRDFERDHGIDIGYRPTGYLFLIPEEKWAAQLEAVALQRQHGVPVEVLDVEQAQKITPFVPDGIGGATWGSADGQVDAHGATVAYLQLARSLGAEVFYNFRVEGIDRAGDSWTVTSMGRSVSACYLVNAAGGWAGELGKLVGFDIPVVHSRRNIYSTADAVLDRYLPMTVDFGTGLYLRSEGDRLLFGGNNPNEQDGYNTSVDWAWMESLLEIGTERFPWLGDLPLDRKGCWAGTYENTPDHNAILGPAPGAPTWVNACGFSGHGLIEAPVAGELVAEQVADGAITSFEVSHLAIERFAQQDNDDQEVDLVF